MESKQSENDQVDLITNHTEDKTENDISSEPSKNLNISNKKKKQKKNIDKSLPTESNLSISDSLKDVESDMLSRLKEIEALQSPNYNIHISQALEEETQKEFSAGLNITNFDEIECELDGSSVDLLLQDLTFSKDNIRNFVLKKAAAIKLLEENDNNLMQKSFKMLQEKLSLFTAVTKSKLENERIDDTNEKLQELCRLSQQRIKLSLENHNQILEKAANHMGDIVSRFRATIEDIQKKIDSHNDSINKQKLENENLGKKIAEFKDHFKLRSEHYATQLKAKSLELQLADAKLDQQTKLLEQEKARSESFKINILQLKSSEKELKAQVAMYSKKFDEFQEALSRSDEMFSLFNEKIKNIDDITLKFKEENSNLVSTKSSLDIKLINLFDEKQRLLEDYKKSSSEKTNTEGVCRALHAERALSKNSGQTNSSSISESSLSESK